VRAGFAAAAGRGLRWWLGALSRAERRAAVMTSETRAGAGTPGKMKRKAFEQALYELQVELTRLQAWTLAEGARIVVVFEGRDTAGKGGVISRITARTSPRVFKHVALPKPSDREKTQMYAQRYLAHLPAAGEIILFDRSWYNRAGVERVMGFCSEAEAERFCGSFPVSSARSSTTVSSSSNTFWTSARMSSGGASRPASRTRSSTGS
jgi:polyphosphate kinase 2 (PPK2 family)